MPGRTRGRRPPGDPPDSVARVHPDRRIVLAPRPSLRKSPIRVQRLRISGDLDRHAVEALHLELRRLARRHGVQIAEFRATLVTDKRGGDRDDP